MTTAKFTDARWRHKSDEFHRKLRWLLISTTTAHK